MVSTTIEAVAARRIFDSRGFPTVEAEVLLSGGARGRAGVPSGASTGSREALELRDGGTVLSGKGVQTAVGNVNRLIGPELVGRDALDQVGVDQAMCDLDGTPNKEKLGANAILAVSLAVARAASAAGGLPLYRYLGGPTARILPVPLLNLINGGAHASNGLEIQEFMVVPAGFPTFGEAFEAGVEIYQALKAILLKEGMSVNVGDEGGFAPDLPSNRAALEILSKAVERAGCRMGREVGLALDVAASEFYRDGRYHLEGRQLPADRMVEYLASLTEDHALVSVEDGLAEDDWDGWEMLTREVGDRAQLIGDDLFVTNEAILAEGIKRGVANSILIKVNQIGTLSETLSTMDRAVRSGYTRVVSHRSGETEDPFIAHLAVGTGAGQIKTGAPARSERTAKYNELLRIEEELGSGARFGGWEALGR
ncbi:MAG: phosphopyruvate hydratase [bacterium]|nr:phosphopyruvate hydratase [bacterium]MDE0601848.1 phosphopyruvate hydratase [bacterium]